MYMSSEAKLLMTCTEDQFSGLTLSEQDNCKVNIIKDNRNFQSTKNKKYLEDGVLNVMNVNRKAIAYSHKEGERLLKGKTTILSNTFKQLMDDLQINFYDDKLRTKKSFRMFYFTHIKISNPSLGQQHVL